MTLISTIDRDIFEHFDNRFNSLIRGWETAMGLPTTLAIQDTTPSTGALIKQVGNSFLPAMDVSENDKEVIVHTNLPGLKKDDVKVEIQGHQLVIFGESSIEKSHEENQWKVRERSYGKFERRVALPKSVDTNQVLAKLDNGVLEVKVAKLPEQQQGKKAITIQ